MKSVMASLRYIVALVFRAIYGVRGGLRPPLGGPAAGRLYPLRHAAWRVLNRLYSWSGLPEQWHRWRETAGRE